jgi:PmbA protein
MSIEEIAGKIMEKAMERTKEAAVIVSEVNDMMIKFANSQPSVVQNWIKTVARVYVNREGRIYVTSIDSPEKIRSLESFLTDTDTYKLVEESFYNAPLPEPEKSPVSTTVLDERISESMKNPAKLIETIYGGVQNFSIDRFAGMIEAGVTKEYVLTSKDFQGKRVTSYLTGYLRAFNENKSGQWSFTTTKYDEKLIKETVQKACEFASIKAPRKKIEIGRTDVILSPMVFSNLVDYIADMSTASSIDMGFSFLAKYKKGEKIGSPLLSIYDTPRNKMLPATTDFDDEGILTYNKPIIEKGVLMNILHNTKTAQRHKEKTTGNAGWITPQPWSLEVKPGEWKLEELISETRKGVLITNNWYTRLQNYIEGEFSTVGRDAILQIEQGEITGYIDRARIADTFPNIIGGIEALTIERHPIQWWEVETPVISPYVKIKNVMVTLPQ